MFVSPHHRVSISIATEGVGGGIIALAIFWIEWNWCFINYFFGIGDSNLSSSKIFRSDILVLLYFCQTFVSKSFETL